MLYRALGLMSGSSLDGLDIVFAEFVESQGSWTFEIRAAACYPYSIEWTEKLRSAVALSAQDYLLLHSAYGRYLGEEVLRFVEENNLHYQIALVASHGHTTFHRPADGMTAQLGDGATIAAVTGLPVVSDLRALDVAFGGQGAPIVPMGESLLFPGTSLFLNIGGIANLSVKGHREYTAFDVCPANRVLNALAERTGKPYDDGGVMAAAGTVHEEALAALNALPYYAAPAPKSLANAFGLDVVLPLLDGFGLSVADALRTYVEHIAVQVAAHAQRAGATAGELMVTGGGAFNGFLMERLGVHLAPLGIQASVPADSIVQYKEALIMALLGVLRWRQAYTTLPSVTGAKRGSIGGALWNGQEA